MQETLNNIINNLTKAKDLLDKVDSNNINIKNTLKENHYDLGRIEVLSRQLVENIELTAKNANG